jgi:hypothetical protein
MGAELVAIEQALVYSPMEHNIRVVTDSKAAIVLIEGFGEWGPS